jgi:hypothetical protein
MKRVPQHRPLASILAFLALIAFAILPLGSVANAASNPTICQPGEEVNSCFLEIVAPQSVAVGQPFTVKVVLFEYGFESSDIPLPKSDFCASKTVVSLDLYQGESFVATTSSKASAGVATFSVTVLSGGSWSLVAHVDHPEGGSNCGYFDDGFADFTAVVVPAGQPIAPCPDNVSCDQETSGSGTAATLFADTGTFSASFQPFDSVLGCGDGGPLDPNGVLSFNLTGGGDSNKTIVFALSPSLVTKGIGQYNVCWNSTNPFTPLGGGAPVNVGYLPNCSPHAGPPCVLYKTSGQHNDAFIGILAPPGDPLAYVE